MKQGTQLVLLSDDDPHADGQSPPLPALLAAAVAALVGAVVWGLIAWLTGYEVGYVAWGIGLLVGLAVVKAGGRGVVTGATAAAMTLVAIFVGKVLGTHFLVEKQLASVREQYFTPALYQELERDAAAWGDLAPAPSEADVRQFMVDHDYGGFRQPEDVPDADLAAFHAYSVPALEQFLAETPAFEDWRREAFGDYRREFDREFDLTSAVVSELNAMDLIFAFLALSTAFGMIKRAEERRRTDDHGSEEPEPPVTHEIRRAA